MTLPTLNDDYYFHIAVSEQTYSSYEISLRIHEQTSRPEDSCVTRTKVADYDSITMGTDPRALIEAAIKALHYNTPQYFKDFEDPEVKFTRALSDVAYPHPQAEKPEPPAYPDFLNPDKLGDITLYGLLSVLKNYCEVLPNTIKNVRPSLSTAQGISVLSVLGRLSTTDRLDPEMDDLFDALSVVLESERNGDYYDLPEEQWEAVEHYYALLAKKVGLPARNAEGELIVLPEYRDADA